MTQHTFLVEIGTEELPPKTLRALAEIFSIEIRSELDAASVRYGKVNWFATPRRLAIQVNELDSAQADIDIENRGPAIIRSFDDSGNPTKAAENWARSCGITVSQADRLSNKKGEWLVYRARVKGKPVKALLCDIVTRSLGKLSIPKMMRWGENRTQFIRPVHTVTMLLDDSVIPGKVLGINSDRLINGHLLMGEREISLEHANQYTQVLLSRGLVMADYLQRKEIIRQDAEAAAKRLGGVADLTDSLLEEVTSLVEWPVVLTACFEEKFLAVPEEALVSTMTGNQKYFPVYDTTGKLMPYFIFVANIESKDPKKIIFGNEKVVRSRLADVEFFFNNDRKKRLEDRLPYLDTVVFQKKLGTLRDKSNRIEALASWIANKIGADVPQAMRAGLLSKCDLTTNMVFEFTNIQGLMGMYYALYDGESKTVALAQKEQYQPRFAGDVLPTTLVSCAVAIADKMDTLTGIFGIGQYPTGDKDPFALRRAALGVLHIIVGKQLPLDLQTLTEEAVRLYGKRLTKNSTVVEKVIDFMLGRFRSWYQEQGYSVDIIRAVLARFPICPSDCDARVRAISYFKTMGDARSLTDINKRISNILAKSDNVVCTSLQASLLKEPAEISLATHLAMIRKKLQPMLEAGRYKDALVELAVLREPVDKFFDSVVVMTEDNQTRVNRMALLSQLRELFLQIADFSLLQ